MPALVGIDVDKNQTVVILPTTTNHQFLVSEFEIEGYKQEREKCLQPIHAVRKPPIDDGTSKARSERGGARGQPCAPISDDGVVPGVSSLDLAVVDGGGVSSLLDLPRSLSSSPKSPPCAGGVFNLTPADDLASLVAPAQSGTEGGRRGDAPTW